MVVDPNCNRLEGAARRTFEPQSPLDVSFQQNLRSFRSAFPGNGAKAQSWGEHPSNLLLEACTACIVSGKVV